LKEQVDCALARRDFQGMPMNTIIKTSLPMPLEAEFSDDPIYRMLPAPGSGAECQSGGADKTAPTNLADLWDKYHRARKIYEKACASVDGTVLPDEVGYG
jgi:hypothetical protein